MCNPILLEDIFFVRLVFGLFIHLVMSLRGILHKSDRENNDYLGMHWGSSLGFAKLVQISIDLYCSILTASCTR